MVYPTIPGKSEVPDIISQKEFSDKVIDKKGIYLKKNNSTKNEPSQKAREP